jgi:hypothetical protein
VVSWCRMRCTSYAGVGVNPLPSVASREVVRADA